MIRRFLFVISASAMLAACGSTTPTPATPKADFSSEAVPDFSGAGAGGESKAPVKLKHIERDASSLDRVLGPMQWGIGHEEALALINAQMMEAYKEEARELYDTAQRDRLRRTVSKRVKTIEASYRELKKGAPSGLELSIVYDEQAKGNGESFLTIRDAAATRYLFFVNDALYKVSVAYNPQVVDGVDFMTFLGSVANKYGPQKETLEDDLAQVVVAVWEKEGTRLKVKDRPEYGAFLMTFTDMALELKVAAAHEQVLTAYLSEPEVGGDILSIKCEGTDCDQLGGSNAAEELVGGVESDLGDQSLSAEEREQIKDGIGAGNTGRRGGADAPKRSGRPKPKKTKPSKKRRELKTIDKIDDADLPIIY